MKRFKRIYIETTNICNLACDFCPKTNRDKKIMSIENFEIIVREIKNITDYIYLHLMGEPLFNKNLRDYLEIAYKNNLKVNITTNGTLIEDNFDILINSKALRQINFSLHSFEGNNSNIDFHKYLNDILECSKDIIENTNIIISFRLWNFDSINNKGKNNLNIEVLKIIKEFFNYEEDILDNLNKNKRIKLQNNLYLNSAEKFSWPDIKIDEISSKGFCHGLRDHFGILSNGDVVPCCLDSDGNIVLGNIFKNTIEEILKYERAINMYNGFSNRNKVEYLCKRCGYSEKFNK